MQSRAKIADFLYGDSRGKDLPPAFDDLEDYAALEQWSAQDWADLLSKWVEPLGRCTDPLRYYVSPPFIGVVGKPSAALSAKLDQAEKDRLAERREKLGEKKLKELEQKLQEAKADSDRPPPEGMITDFPITDVRPTHRPPEFRADRCQAQGSQLGAGRDRYQQCARPDDQQ